MAQLTTSTSATLLLRTLLRPASLQCVAHKSTGAAAADDLDLDALTKDSGASATVELVHDADHEQRELHIEQSRNKSRLQPQHRNQLNDTKPYGQSQSWVHNTVKYQRMQFGRFGLANGVDPRLCFATPAEKATRTEYERIAYPQTLGQMVAESTRAREERKRAVAEREEGIAKRLGKLDQWMGELNAKVAKREQDARVARERKERLVEEVRRQFGFKMDARDERFQELLAQKEKEDKKRQKEEKKKVKDERMLAKLQEQHSLEFAKPSAPASS